LRQWWIHYLTIFLYVGHLAFFAPSLILALFGLRSVAVTILTAFLTMTLVEIEAGAVYEIGRLIAAIIRYSEPSEASQQPPTMSSTPRY
jgi:hypothetical protein